MTNQIPERLLTMLGQWAKMAQTNIPTPPIPGIAYRNASLAAADFEAGQAYDKVYDSARYNQRDYIITGLLQYLEQYSGLPWSSLTNYPVGGFVLGMNGKLYQAVAASGPKISGGAKDPTIAANTAYWLDYAASITPPAFEKYDIGQYCWFEDEMPRPGLFSCLGGVVQNFSAKYPKAAAYFETSYGKKRLVTQAQYDALHVAIWHTCADGTKIGWNGIGGVNRFVWDKQADTLRLPDLAGMTPEQVGFSDSLGVGGVRGDEERLMRATFGSAVIRSEIGDTTTGIKAIGAVITGIKGGVAANINRLMYSVEGIDNSLTVPTGPRNHGPRWVSDARVYLGVPVS